jgi:hypothetical protein
LKALAENDQKEGINYAIIQHQEPN